MSPIFVDRYTFVSRSICYLKPASMRIYTSQVGISGGYNTLKFDPTNGFIVNSGFPSNGFKGAQFSLIGSGNDQSKYRCTMRNGAGKSVYQEAQVRH